MAAAHAGHCQRCGALQMLPKGVLSLHGYKVTQGFFNGVCRGAGELPYEQSCAKIHDYVMEARNLQGRLVVSRERILRLTASAMVHFVHTEGILKGQDFAAEAVVTMTEETRADSTYASRTFTATITRTGQTAQVLRHDFSSQTVADACAKLNAHFVASTIDRELSQLRFYIHWQADRIANWKLTDCLPATAKDPWAGFLVAERKEIERAQALDNGLRWAESRPADDVTTANVKRLRPYEITDMAARFKTLMTLQPDVQRWADGYAVTQGVIDGRKRKPKGAL